MSLRLALVGMGRMGRALEALAPDRGCEVVARLGTAAMAHRLSADDLNGAQVAIEFTTPEAALPNTEALLAVGCPVVIGTTGWTPHAARLASAVAAHRCGVVWSPNFSVGVQLFLQIVEEAARRLRGVDGFDLQVVETHHAGKKDAPSGTGIAIAERVATGTGRRVGISSVRVGSVPGTHELMLDAPFEQIRLVHEARDRRVFADGALVAARWLAAQATPAVYTMRDVLGPGSP